MTYIERCWRDYELPNGRMAESFAYKVDEGYDDYITDTLYTDDKSEADRLVAAMLSQGYDAHVTHGSVTETKMCER